MSVLLQLLHACHIRSHVVVSCGDVASGLCTNRLRDHPHRQPLLQTDDSEVIKYLPLREIIPLCLMIMETGTELSRTVRLQTRVTTE
jgi:hypothetical protein